MDNDDEVRDRATYFRAILDKQEAALNSMYILNGMQVGDIFIFVGDLSKNHIPLRNGYFPPSYETVVFT
jgi:hypothetical protein